MANRGRGAGRCPIQVEQDEQVQLVCAAVRWDLGRRWLGGFGVFGGGEFSMFKNQMKLVAMTAGAVVRHVEHQMKVEGAGACFAKCCVCGKSTSTTRIAWRRGEVSVRSETLTTACTGPGSVCCAARPHVLVL